MASGAAVGVLVLTFLLPIGALAQPGLDVRAGPTFPVGGFRRVGGAQVGWMAHGRFGLAIQRRLNLVAGGFYGANRQEPSDPQSRTTSKVVGVMVGLEYRISDPGKPGLFVFYEAGRAFRSWYDYTERNLAVSAGAGFAFPLSPPAEVRISGAYFGPLLSTDFATVGLSAGIHLFLGSERRSPP